MLIAQIDVPQNEDRGDFYYRTYAPGTAMAQEVGIYVINLTYFHPKRDEIIKEADVLILNNICDPDLLPVIRSRKESRKLTVYELSDDLDALPPWNPVYPFYQNPENSILLKTIARSCDAIQFSSQELSKKYGYLNSTCVVFPNHMLALPPERRFARRKQAIIGWGGSFGHLEDIRSIAEPLIRWIVTKEDVCLHLMCSDAIWNLFRDLPEDRKKRFETGSLLDYYQFLSTIDIGIAPLLDCAYNRSRSDVKFLEYAAHSVVPVVQRATPYFSAVRHDQNGYFFENAKELIQILDNLAHDFSTRIRVAICARDYVVEERWSPKRIKESTSFYRTQLDRRMRVEQPQNGCQRVFESLASTEGAALKNRHLMLLPTSFELMLRIGLTTSSPAERAKASQAFKQASHLEPGNYLPHLLGAYHCGNPVDSFLKALEKNPHSIKAWMLLGEEFSKNGNTNRALECFNSAARVYPKYGVPQLKAASLYKSQNRQDDSKANERNTLFQPRQPGSFRRCKNLQREPSFPLRVLR